MNNPANSSAGHGRLILEQTTAIDVSHMSELFILQNQDKLFLGKQKEWLDGRDPGSLFKTLYKDEAVNQMCEVSSKDYTQRIKVLGCAANEKGLPIIDAELMPPPQPRVARSAVDKTIASPEEEVTALVEDGNAVDLSVNEAVSESDTEADDLQKSLL